MEETKCYCGHTTYCDCGPEEPKKETIKKERIMSTTFGIPQRQVELSKLVDEFGDLQDYIDTSFFEKVFFRSMNNSRWLNPLSSRLSDDTIIFPLDNSAQGIYTIGDARKFLKEKENEANSQI